MVSRKTLDYLQKEVDSCRAALKRAEAARDDEAIGDLQANLMEAQAELNNAEAADREE